MQQRGEAEEEIKEYKQKEKEKFDTIIKTTLSELSKYKNSAYFKLEKVAKEEIRKKRSELEKELDGLKEQLEECYKVIARKKGDISQAQFYVLRRLEEIFPDYDTFGTENDITSRIRAEYARELYKTIEKKEVELNHEDIVSLVIALSENVNKKGFRKFTNSVFKNIIEEAIWIAKRTKKENVPMIIKKIHEIKPSRKKTIKEIHGVLETLM